MNKTAPNLIFVLPDQMRADFLPVYGSRGILTPHLDALAKEATVFDRAYSNCPLCVPARAALLSGLSPLRSGVLSNGQWLRPDLAEMGFKTWPDLLRDAGYRTAAIGKMHFYPFDAMEGFDERVIAEDKRWVHVHDDYAEFLARHGLSKFDARTHPQYQSNMGAVSFPHAAEFTPDRFVAEASVDFIRRQPPGHPFALMVGFPSPHCPYDALPEYASQVDPEGLPPLISRKVSFFDRFVEIHRKAWHAIDYSDFPEGARERIRVQYAGLIKQIDEETGRIIQACKEKGIWENTLFVFSSDHGDHVGDRGMVGKKDFYEESIRIPLMVKAPGQTEGRRVRTMVELQQVTPTLLEYAGREIPDWYDYRPLPKEDSPCPEETVCFGVLSTGCMARKGPWKLMEYQEGQCRELYHLDEDPAEIRNRIDDPDCQEVRLELGEALRFWLHRQAVSGHAEKALSAGGGLSGDVSFGRRGWRRTYPLPVFIEAGGREKGRIGKEGRS